MLAAIASTVSGLTSKQTQKGKSLSYALDDEKEVDNKPSVKEVSSKRQTESEEVDGAQEFDEEAYSAEMEEALANVRKLGKVHQEELIDAICDNFYDLNGIEATAQDISSIFARMKLVFAEEAIDDEVDESDDLGDADYDENAVEDIKQAQDDEEEDYTDEEEE